MEQSAAIVGKNAANRMPASPGKPTATKYSMPANTNAAAVYMSAWRAGTVPYTMPRRSAIHAVATPVRAEKTVKAGPPPPKTTPTVLTVASTPAANTMEERRRTASTLEANNDEAMSTRARAVVESRYMSNTLYAAWSCIQSGTRTSLS